LRSLPLRTISGRIALGFFVLLATFGVVSGYTIFKMRQLGSDLEFVRTAYLETALAVAQLNSLQSGMVDQLDSTAPLAPLPRPFVSYSRQIRVKLIQQSIAALRQLEDVSKDRRSTIETSELKLQRILTQYHQNDPLFETAFSPQAAADAKPAALKELARRERHISSEINSWFVDLKTNAIRITLNLQEVEGQATLAAFVLGAVGAILGVLATVWSILTLRPLRRLHEAVRKVAGGNYRQQVEVSGGTEVADLAREFNVMAAALSQREQELVRSERLAAVGKMAAVITHEVRNPLSSIGLNAELLEEEVANVSPEAVALCRAIEKEVDRLTAITEEYLRFARLPRPRLEREHLNSIVAGVIEFQKEDLLSRGVRVEAHLAEALPPVSADEGQLRQALLNLLRNAADAMTGGGELTVTTRRGDDGAVEVSVQDSGPGIADEHLPKIFEPFFSTKDGGTGLGLALTQQIVAEHGGRIVVESRPGAGTTFTLRLPAALSA
jgi:signal transduction histidine kinase